MKAWSKMATLFSTSKYQPMNKISTTKINNVLSLLKTGEVAKAKRILYGLPQIATLLKEIPKIKGINRVNHFSSKGYEVDERPMGSGGVGQVRLIKQKNEVRVQLTYGRGLGNYAWVIIFNF